MKRLFITGLVLAFFGGTAFADCDFIKKTTELQQELQKLAINQPEKFEELSPELEKWAEEMSTLADEKFSDTQRMNKICLQYEAILKRIKTE